MIGENELGRYPAVPESEVEWEDLLYRLELMLKGLPVTLETAEDLENAFRVLDQLVRREAEVAAFLRDACREEGDDAAARFTSPAALPTIEERAEEFRRLRARVFAMVQRRGIEVWSWTGALPDGGRATIYRVLRHLQREDTRALASIRKPEAAASC